MQSVVCLFRYDLQLINFIEVHVHVCCTMTLRDLDRSTFRRFTLEMLDYIIIYYYIMLEDQIKLCHTCTCTGCNKFLYSLTVFFKSINEHINLNQTEIA